VLSSDPDSDDPIASGLDVVDGDTEGEDVDMVNAESGASLIDTLARESKLTFE
jgi:hypothetical protein